MLKYYNRVKVLWFFIKKIIYNIIGEKYDNKTKVNTIMYKSDFGIDNISMEALQHKMWDYSQLKKKLENLGH